MLEKRRDLDEKRQTVLKLGEAAAEARKLSIQQARESSKKKTRKRRNEETIMENMVLDAWNDLSYGEGVLFTVWLFILYYGKVWIDTKFKHKECTCLRR